MSDDGDACEECAARARVIRRLLQIAEGYDDWVQTSGTELRGQALAAIEQRDAALREVEVLRAELERTVAAAVEVIAEHVGRRT